MTHARNPFVWLVCLTVWLGCLFIMHSSSRNSVHTLTEMSRSWSGLALLGRAALLSKVLVDIEILVFLSGRHIS